MRSAWRDIRHAFVSVALRFYALQRARDLREVARTIAAASFSAILGACVSQPNYPGATPPQDPRRAGLEGLYVRTCPQLGGRYLDQGNRLEEDGSLGPPVSLTQLLIGATGEVDVVTITYASDEALVVESWRGAERVAGWTRPPWNPFTLMLRKETRLTTSYMCAGGTIMVETAFGGGAAVGVGFAESHTQLLISERADGSLAVRHVDSGAGVIVIVPFYRSTSVWYRFPTTAPAERK